jgi:release factor glutamine methyltransferase
MEAQQLAAHVLRVDRAWLLAHPEEEFNELAGEQLIQRRLASEPLAYILGWREFYGRPFGVDRSVLIPRHETETVIELALALAPPSLNLNGGAPAQDNFSVLDVGTGSGILAITLKLERPHWEMTAVDISPEAIATASASARFLGAKVRLVVSDLFAGVLGESFDMIVANPPYIGTSETLPREVADHEPATALYGGADGLDFYRRIAAEAPTYLHDGGLLIVEVGHTQADSVRALLEENGWSHVETRKDLSGTERAIAARFFHECAINA